MKTIRFELYGKVTHQMTLNLLGYANGRANVSYTFGPIENPELFTGDEFSPSPTIATESDESAISLLGFLTLAPGDTDDDYFRDYTIDQLDFANGIKDSDLSMLVYDWEDGNFDNIYVDYDTNGDITIAVDNPPDQLSCDQCNPIMINGVFCHETGCINANEPENDDQWDDELNLMYEF